MNRSVGLARAEMRRCGKPYGTREAAEASPRGKRPGARAEKCLRRDCGQWHVKSPPVSVDAPVRLVRARPETGFSRAVKLAARTRAGKGDPAEARCECCGAWLGLSGGDYQHRLARGAGGSRSAVVNGVASAAVLCRPCHALCESRDEGMRACGWWIRSGKGSDHDPRLVPVVSRTAAGDSEPRWFTESGGETDIDPRRAAA
jgi:hypothetical protein